MDNKTSIEQLNTILKDEYMSIDSYDKFIQDVNEENVKIELQKIQQNHKHHAIKLAEKIQNLGGNPIDNIGIQGMLALALSNLNNAGEKDSLSYLKKAYDEENTRIKNASQVVSKNIDEESSSLVNNILSENKNNINSLNLLINGLNTSSAE
ncbi:DUF2383 domain-containing protein [Clostridium aestuarii]|uniref:DUF2383 domain-containing protein n=1 Tax=Clostridium aestuarii TaxID=338193 RepID=A0ABT4CVR0_9CLOT|nr:DUF2383 domain-containing protein [Clostridium aestuarii]MCY6483066.1 DUF2383 domain-containing protein [Clostridium aestuarii]